MPHPSSTAHEVADSSAPGNTVPPAVIHVDLDGLVDIYRTRGWPVQGQRDPVFETGLTNALELFERNSVRATLFLIADTLDDPVKRELVEEAVRRGHEIACHTLNHRILLELNREQKREQIAGGRAAIEDRLAVSVTGFRAPGYQLDRECIELLAESGYEYDSSAFPTAMFARRLGVPVSTLLAPGRPFGDCGLTELPLPSHEGRPFPFNPSYSLLLGQYYFRSGLLRFRKRAAPLVLLFHLIDLAEALPAALLPGWKARLFTLSVNSAAWKQKQCQKMLDLVRHHYRITTTQDLRLTYTGVPQPAGGAN